MKHSIRRQLTRKLVLTLSGLLGAGLIGIGASLWWTLRESFDQTLRARASAIALISEIEKGRAAFDLSADFLRDYGLQKRRNFFQVRDGSGASLVRSPSLREGDLPAGIRTPGERARFWNLVLPDGRSGRAIEVAVTPHGVEKLPAGSPLAGMVLVVASDREELDETLATLLAGVAACGILLIACVLLVVPRVLRKGLAPLSTLGENVAGIDANKLASRFPVADMPAELQPITERLNALLARLEQSFERERQFSADLAHELRTPLAELRSMAECALKWPETRGTNNDRDVLAIATQMETMVSRMLELARNERTRSTVPLQALEIEPLIKSTWMPFAERAGQKALTVQFQTITLTASGDPTLLQSILRNLLDNAVEYAPQGSAIGIMCGRQGDTACITVTNTAPELGPADMPHLFERFWRKEASRTGGGAHLGLGLALSAASAGAMGWTLGASLEENSKRLEMRLCCTATQSSRVS